MIPPQTPFLLHTLIETFAGLVFVLNPNSQLPVTKATRDVPATLLVHSFGGAILSSALISFIFGIKSDWDETSSSVSFAFAFWHLWPCYRAAMRIHTRADSGTEQARSLGGPAVHLITHVAFVAGFIWSGLQ
jgi:hypothetical protein